VAEVSISELWHAIQTGKIEVQSSAPPVATVLYPLAENAERLLQEGLLEGYEGYLELYLQGNYRELLRALQHASVKKSLHIVLLKVLCLLHMAAANESIGNKKSLDYLRDEVLPELKQFESKDGSDIVAERRKWLEAFCLGHEPPDYFWEAIGVSAR